MNANDKLNSRNKPTSPRHTPPMTCGDDELTPCGQPRLHWYQFCPGYDDRDQQTIDEENWERMRLNP